MYYYLNLSVARLFASLVRSVLLEGVARIIRLRHLRLRLRLPIFTRVYLSTTEVRVLNDYEQRLQRGRRGRE